MTLEDESGIANLIIRPRVFDRHRAAARHGRVVLARGRVERQGKVVHVMAKRLETIEDRLEMLATRSRDFR